MAADVKIAVLGAGSYVFGPGVLHSALLEHRLRGIELALMDPDEEAVFAMADVARRMAQRGGVDTLITAHTDRAPALEGARFVICCASRETSKRFATDCNII